MPLPRGLRWSELDGVADQVRDDLAETERVSDELVGDVRVHVVSQVQVILGRPHDEGLEDTEDSLAERVRHGLHGHPTGFDWK